MAFTRDDEIELAALQAKLRARSGRPGLAGNVADIERRIAELTAKRNG